MSNTAQGNDKATLTDIFGTLEQSWRFHVASQNNSNRVSESVFEIGSVQTLYSILHIGLQQRDADLKILIPVLRFPPYRLSCFL